MSKHPSWKVCEWDEEVNIYGDFSMKTVFPGNLLEQTEL